jgi:hypothetical protein
VTALPLRRHRCGTGLTLRQSYRDIFAITVVKTSSVFVVIWSMISPVWSRAFSGEVDAGSPQKMRPLKEKSSEIRFR